VIFKEKSGIMTKNNFKIQVSDWTKINVDNAKFILEEAKDYVKYLSDASDKITNRAFAILAILIPITSALIVFVVNEGIKPVDSYEAIYNLLFIAIIALRDLCIKEFLGIDFDAELAKLSIVLGEIEASQVKIDYNEKQVSDRTKLLKYLMLSIGILFILIILILWILLFKNSRNLCS
jgi:hypothetical protein